MINQKFFHEIYGWGTIADIEIPITQHSLVLVEWHYKHNKYGEPPSTLPWGLISEYIDTGKEN